MIYLPLLVLLVVANQEDVYCEKGNHFVFLSTYTRGLQTDLKLTFADINATAKIDEVHYQDELFRNYRIYNISQNISYNQGNQTAKLAAKNVLRVTGGNAKVTLAFNWTKTQLGVSLNGSGTGSVTSDIISYQKTLLTNTTHQLQWHLSYSQPLVITNGISLNTIDPYRAADYEILSNMLNKLKNNQTTVKDNLLRVINANLQAILRQKVIEDVTLKFDKYIFYEYIGYRGAYEINFTNILVNSTLAQDGLYLLFSQSIKNDSTFQCGEPVPFEPFDTKTFGGLQEFVSNSLIKSCLRYAVNLKALDVTLTEEFWQSRAFQFYVGDLHDVMPSSTKQLPTMQEIKGGCSGLDDPVFSFGMKNTRAYESKVNFACSLQFNKTRFIGINLVATYQITPRLSSKALDFQLTSITGSPAFDEISPYKIEYQELAEFMVSETINIAKNGMVFGSNYKMKYSRKRPSMEVRKDYLFLYDNSALATARTE